MIQVPAQASVFVMHESVSFRKGIDGMIAMVHSVLREEPMSGAFFVFRNRGRQMLRILFYDGGGFWLCTRRLSKGTFSNWPTGEGQRPCSSLLARDLQVLIWGGNPASCAFPELWRKVGQRCSRELAGPSQSLGVAH
jgi:transposase